ncbi:MAG: heavy-metal-associated domain-containing protein [Bacteroidia bacterium]|nr:heavy-metal-associated domain-containing protein [Bacteroidia bacterium]
MNINKFIAIAFMLAIGACGNKKESETTLSTTEIVNGITTSTFKVWGNCGMCKETIEGSVEVEGVSEADWNTETKMIKVSYDTIKISLDQIQKNIAAVGYDNEKYKGDVGAYNNLPECCQYIRRK